MYIVLFQTIQFSMSTPFSSIGPKDMTLSGATTLGQCGAGAMAMKWYSVIPKTRALLKPHRQIV